MSSTAPEPLFLNKNRLEALSDGVFAIVMTLLVIEIKVPEIIEKINTAHLLEELTHLRPIFISYFLTFAIISVLWLAHHFLFHGYAKTINRGLVQLNVVFLSFLSLIPFSSHFLGTYLDQPLAIVIFGTNMLLAYLMIFIMQFYILNSKDVENNVLSLRIIRQGRVRMLANLICTFFGIGFGLLNPYLGIVLFIIPVIFNAVPGILNKLEKIFGFEL
jgi:uncharacterized membrane protein